MSRQIHEDLANICESIVYGEKMSMKVGSGAGTTGQAGDLDGPAKETNKGTGAENSEVATAPDAEADLQGDTIEGSKKKKGGTTSKFDELYKNVVEEELEGGSVESPSFNDEIGDFPPAGADEESAERDLEDDGLGGGSIKDLFNSLADIMAKIGDKLSEDEDGLGDGEMITGEEELADGDSLEEEAVESTPAPDSVGKLTSKGNMNVKGVKVVKKAVSSSSSGEEAGGKTQNCPDTNLGPDTSLKANGSGAAVDGKDASAFE